jgi:tetratricopeptide (TPR) repeat protein
MAPNLKPITCRLRPARLAWAIALPVILAVANAVAQIQFDPAHGHYDPKVIAMLPPYCKHTQLYNRYVPGGDNRTQIARWESVMGAQNFQHMHHYCWGLAHTNWALFSSNTRQERDRELRQSVTELDYVLRNVAPDFALLPEILTRRGENQLRLENWPQGLNDLHRAIELKPDHWPPYAALTDYYRALGELDSAREWVEKGLSAAPGTRALERRLSELKKAKTARPASAN